MGFPLLDQTKQGPGGACFVLVPNEILLYSWSLLKAIKESTLEKSLDYLKHLWFFFKAFQDSMILKSPTTAFP